MSGKNCSDSRTPRSGRFGWRSATAAAAALLATITAGAMVAPSMAGADGSRAASSHHAQLPAAKTVHATPAAPSLVVGNLYCGGAHIAPGTGVVAGTRLTVNIRWLGSPTNKKCLMPISNCGGESFPYTGPCSAGYWLVGIFCNPLAAINLAKGQQYCDMNNVVVLTDNNAGPNNPTDNHGTSYNQCTTVQTLGSIFGGLPGTLFCVADKQTGDGWASNWTLGSLLGGAAGPAPMTGSKVPFKPSNTSADCPPSAANIKAGAIPGYCAFTVLPVTFSYYCVLDVCAPNPSLPNKGSAELTADHLGILYKYLHAPAASKR